LALKARGYPGDARLLERFIQLFGRSSVWGVFFPSPATCAMTL
jgi:hypothetical protein